jgi:hypothetical protein
MLAKCQEANSQHTCYATLKAAQSSGAENKCKSFKDFVWIMNAKPSCLISNDKNVKRNA